jgi:hypothetical protein
MGRVRDLQRSSPASGRPPRLHPECRAFLEEASRFLATGERRIPVLFLVDGRGCDPRWTWHTDPDTPYWSDGGTGECSHCPSVVEANKAIWVGAVTAYCPWSARVVAVHR